MKIRLLFFTVLLLLCQYLVYAQPGAWTWVKGSDSINSPGNYAARGIALTVNEPCARYACGYWTDTAGNFWIYSGTNAPDDLWKFNPITNKWTWMTGSESLFAAPNIAAPRGVFSALNSPGQLSYGMLTWLTPDNHFWLFGGTATVPNSSLWQYNPAINQWAWMDSVAVLNYGIQGIGSPTTMPDGRDEGNCAWTDEAGNLWFFGGNGYSPNISHNDVWKYDVTSGIWTWMSGSSHTDDLGNYGTPGVPSQSAYPASRSSNLSWKDSTGNFWLAGGIQFSNPDLYQDIWKFNPLTLEWTWVKGTAGNDTNILGSNCMADTLNQFGPRYENRANWKVCDDLVITYGGFDFATFENIKNDLWAYKVSANEWIKINAWSFDGNYGTLGVANLANYPCARNGPVGFKDRYNNIWLFGGYKVDSVGNFYGFLNDFWKYAIDTNCISLPCSFTCNLASPLIETDKNNFCPNDSASICAPSGFSIYQWNTGNSDSCVQAKQAGDYYVTVTDNNGCSAASNHIAISILPSSPISITVTGDTLSAYHANSYQWYLNGILQPGDTGAVLIAAHSGTYTVAVTDTNGCIITSTGQVINLSGITGLQEAIALKIYPDPASDELNIGYILKQTTSLQITVTDLTGRCILNVLNQKELGGTYLHRVNISQLATGVYMISFMTEIGNANLRFVKE